MGVATSGAMLFRQIGGSIGVALFGAIFANRLARATWPSGCRACSCRRRATPAAVRHLPPAIHDAYVHAFAASLQPVFLVGAVRRRGRVRAHLAPARGAAAQGPGAGEAAGETFGLEEAA